MRLLTRNRPKAKRAEIALRQVFKRMLRQACEAAITQAKKRLGKVEKGDVFSFNYDFEQYAGELALIFGQLWADGYAEAARQVSKAGLAVSTSDDLAERAANWAEEHAGKLITQVSQTTKDQVSSEVAMAVSEGWSNDELASNLKEVYAFSDERANMIATTETAYADVSANMELYRDVGVEMKEWVLEADACDSCQANAAIGPIAIDANFPSGVDAPPDHPNCRCDVLPVISTNGQKED